MDYVIIIVDGYYGCVNTSTSAFHFNQSKKTICTSFPDPFHSNFRPQSLQNRRSPTKFTRRRCTKLHEIFPNWIPIKHCIKGGNFVNSHSWHLQDLCHVIHCWNWKPIGILTLSQFEQRDHGCFFILRGILWNYFLDFGLVFACKSEFNLWTIPVRFPML